MVFEFHGLWFVAPSLSKVQDKSKINIFQVKNQETQFLHVCTKPCIDTLLFIFIGSPEAILSTIRA